nr:MAG TPA: PD-(D/E)XK nuclease superfamily protein [Caudoviricetes sp.]
MEIPALSRSDYMLYECYCLKKIVMIISTT